MEAHWATVWESIADAIGDEVALVQGGRRRSWAELDDRAARLASAFANAGAGPNARVAQYLYNSLEYVESYYATLKGRGVPINVNYRYVGEELLHIVSDSGAEVLLYHASLADRVADIRERLGGVKLLIEVEDSDRPPATVAGSVRYRDVVARHSPAARIVRGGDDRAMTYTGATTGMPKGVVGRVGPGVRALLSAVPPMLGEPGVTDPAAAAEVATTLRDAGRRLVVLPACPLMHGTGMVIGLHTSLVVGGTIVLLESRRFDPDEAWAVVERERVGLLAIVGDAFGRPLLRALRDGPHRDLSSLRYISSSGAMWSAEVRAALLERLPQLTLLDYISSTEGLMGVAISSAGRVASTGRFTPVPGVKVFTDDGTEVAAGSGDAGIVGLSGGVPDGYHNDPAKSARTFRVVGGVRYSFPGDWATVEADGSLLLLGRGSQCINTGGEKVFPEEVEEALKLHQAIDDCLVFGVPDERFGQRIVAVAAPAPGQGTDAAGALAEAGRHLASYKLPRQVVFVETVPRAPNGKADYRAAKALFEGALTGRTQSGS